VSQTLYLLQTSFSFSLCCCTSIIVSSVVSYHLGSGSLFLWYSLWSNYKSNTDWVHYFSFHVDSFIYIEYLFIDTSFSVKRKGLRFFSESLQSLNIYLGQSDSVLVFIQYPNHQLKGVATDRQSLITVFQHFQLIFIEIEFPNILVFEDRPIFLEITVHWSLMEYFCTLYVLHLEVGVSN